MGTVTKTEYIAANIYRTIEEDPQYFGGYLNMARHNVFLIINHLTEVFDTIKNKDGENFNALNDDENICSPTHILSQIFDPSIKKFEHDRVKVYNYLIKRHYLPFIKIFNSENINLSESKNLGIDFFSLHNFILTSFKMLNELRNAYSHFLAIDDNGNKILKRSNTVHKSIKTDIELLFKLAPQYSFIRNHETQSEEDYNHLLEKYSIFEADKNTFTDQGLYFFINLFLERNHATKFLKRIKGFKNETTPPFRATIQAFTSYALKIPDIRLSNEHPTFSLLMDMLTELNKCPKELFNHLTEKDKKEFEPMLNAEGKHNVILNSTNYEKITDDEIDETIKDITVLKRYNDRFPFFALRFLDETNALTNIRFQITIGKLIVKRYEKEIAGEIVDRRVIKTINAFGKLSDFIDNEKNILQKLKKNCADIDDIQFEQFSPHYNISNNKVAFYIFDQNTNKIKYPSVFENKKNNIDIQNNPDGFISIHDLPKLLLLEHLVPTEPEKTISYFIKNTNTQIFDISELNKIRKRANYNPESFTKRINKDKDLISKKGIQYLSNIKKNELLKKFNLSEAELLALDNNSFKNRTNNKKYIEHFTQIKYQYYLQQRASELEHYIPEGVRLNMLPERILDYLMNISATDSKKAIHNKVRAIRDEAKQLKKAIENEIKKPKKEQQIKLGEIATFITRDIIKMVVNKEVKYKITTPYYNKLQNKIAYFSLNKTDIVTICEKLNLFDNRKGHVFLKKDIIKNSDGIIDFALKYLTAKDKWIEEHLLIKGKTGGYRLTEKEIPHSLIRIKNNLRNFDFITWAKNKATMPIDLPRSLFDEILKKIIRRRLTSKSISFSTGDKFSVLLSKYLNYDTQPFYNYTRSYNINKKPVEFDLHNKSGKELKAKFGAPVEKNEKLIRFTQTKDRILKLLCDKLLSLDKTIGLQNGFNLKDIHPNAKHNPLESPATFQQKIIRKGNKVYCNIIAKDSKHQIQSVQSYNDLKSEEEREASLNQEWYQWTIKDFGRFKKFSKDRRIANLANYFEEINIPFDLLEYQIREYNKYREAIFNNSFKLEKYISDFDYEGIKKIEFNPNCKSKKLRPKGFYEIQFDIYLEWLDNKKIVYNKKLVNECRNKFSHSEFPQIKEIKKITKQQIDDFECNKHIKDYKKKSKISIPEKIYELYTTEIENIIENVNNLK